MTRAQLEVVTSLVTIPLDVVCELPRSGLDRISISLHSLDTDRYFQLYGGGSLSSFHRRLAILTEACNREAPSATVDFAMVTMQSNLAELTAIVSQAGARSVSVHPVIVRESVPGAFEQEVDCAGLTRGTFWIDLNRGIEAARKQTPAVQITVARPVEPGKSWHSGGLVS